MVRDPNPRPSNTQPLSKNPEIYTFQMNPFLPPCNDRMANTISWNSTGEGTIEPQLAASFMKTSPNSQPPLSFVLCFWKFTRQHAVPDTDYSVRDLRLRVVLAGMPDRHMARKGELLSIL